MWTVLEIAIDMSIGKFSIGQRWENGDLGVIIINDTGALVYEDSNQPIAFCMNDSERFEIIDEDNIFEIIDDNEEVFEAKELDMDQEMVCIVDCGECNGSPCTNTRQGIQDREERMGDCCPCGNVDKWEPIESEEN